MCSMGDDACNEDDGDDGDDGDDKDDDENHLEGDIVVQYGRWCL